MRAMVLRRAPGRLACTAVPDPSPGPGEVLLHVAACPVCRTDLHIVNGERHLPAGPWRERIEDALDTANRASREFGADRPGRMPESATTARHAVDPRSDPHRAAKAELAQRLAVRLEDACGSNKRLFLVAPQAFLGSLRAALGETGCRRLHRSLAKDLTQVAPGDTAERFDAAPPA